jgi:hypothetical protein
MPKQTAPRWHGALFLALACGLCARAAAAGEVKSRVWSDIFEGWDAEPVCGTSSSPLPPGFFQQGPRLESGGAGVMVAAGDGTKYIALGSAICRVNPAGRVELLAGAPGLAGHRDGRADRALFNGISVLALGAQGELLVLEQANRCLRSLVPQPAGVWQVKTLAGNPAWKERRDGPAAEASFENPCGMTVFDDGSIFFMDNNFLRLLKDGRVSTVNAAGGAGFSDGPLASARFRIAFTSNCLTSDAVNVLHVADMWNNVLRRIDWKKQEIATVAGGPIRGDPRSDALRKGRDPLQDGQGMEAFFHPGGGISTVWCDRHTGNVYIGVADDDYPHVCTPDGWVRSLRGDMPVASDGEGRVYTAGAAGIRMLRKLKPGEKPYQPEKAPAGEAPLFTPAPFDPASIPGDVPRVRIARPASPPVVDGKLDDECWRKARPFRLTSFKGLEMPKDTATDVYIAADAKSFYMAFKCLEPDLEGLKTPNRHHDDEAFHTDDYVEIFLIPGLDPQGDVFQLMVNRAGTTWEGKNKNSAAWNPKLEVKALRADGAWTVELALPVSELDSGGKQAQWRVNLGRSRARAGAAGAQESSWSALHSSSSHVYQRFNIVDLESREGTQP